MDWLIRSKKLDRLKKGGKVVSAQATTTERSQINVEQQLRWHFLIEHEWEYLRKTNKPTSEFVAEQEHFQLNLDETCFLCSDGVLKIIGDKGKKRHDKNVADNRLSLTVVRCGNAAGNNGPVVFIGTGQNQKLNRLFRPSRLTKHYNLPAGSKMILNKSAYMDDETWVSVVQAMAPGIRQMPVIRDHPDWELLLTLDGFKSHVNVQETMTIWSQHKIRIAKEEAGTSHINQAYDQQQAKVDKQMARELLDKCRGKIRGNMDQYQLVAILIVGIRNLPSSA